MGDLDNSATERLLPDPIRGAEVAGKGVSLVRKIWEEKKKLWVVAGPAIFTRFSTFGVSVITQAFMGHIGPTELAAYAIVFTVLTRFANGILAFPSEHGKIWTSWCFNPRQPRVCRSSLVENGVG